MKKKAMITAMGALFLTGSVLCAEGLEAWAQEFAAPKATLLKVLAKHENAAPELIGWESANPGQMKELVDFLVERGDRSISDFCDKKEGGAAELRKTLKAAPDALQGFRSWIHGEPAAARALVNNSDVFKTLFKDAEASGRGSSKEDDKKADKKKKKK